MDMQQMDDNNVPPIITATYTTTNNQALPVEVVIPIRLEINDSNTKVSDTTVTTTAPLEDKSFTSKKDKKREAIDGQAREIIFKVIKFFESEKRNRGYTYPVENVMKRASAATGLSESTIKRIKRDGLQAEANNTKMTGPKKRRIRRTKVQLDYYQLCALRNIVNGYSNRKEVPTLSKILASAKTELDYRGGKESLRLILLNKLGIKFKKCEKKNKKPPEQPPPPVIQQNNQIHHTMPMHPPTSIHNSMMHPQLTQMKAPDSHCVYGEVMSTLIGL